MNGKVIATIFTVIRILWVLAIGYFTVLSIINHDQVTAS